MTKRLKIRQRTLQHISKAHKSTALEPALQKSCKPNAQPSVINRIQQHMKTQYYNKTDEISKIIKRPLNTGDDTNLPKKECNFFSLNF